MIEAELDEDGYPTEEFLESIKTAKPDESERYPDFCYGLLDAIRPIWRYAEAGYWSSEKAEDAMGQPVMRYEISTAGWSGNEDIMDALQDNHMFWTLGWLQTRRGGHYTFEFNIL